MNKKRALAILIEQSLLIPEHEKPELIRKISVMTTGQVNDLGKLLAADKKREIESFEPTINYINEKIKQLDNIKK